MHNSELGKRSSLHSRFRGLVSSFSRRSSDYKLIDPDATVSTGRDSFDRSTYHWDPTTGSTHQTTNRDRRDPNSLWTGKLEHATASSRSGLDPTVNSFAKDEDPQQGPEHGTRPDGWFPVIQRQVQNNESQPVELTDGSQAQILRSGWVARSTNSTDTMWLVIRVVLWHPDFNDCYVVWTTAVCGDKAHGGQFVVKPWTETPRLEIKGVSSKVSDVEWKKGLKKGLEDLRNTTQGYPNNRNGEPAYPSFAKASQVEEIKEHIDEAGEEAWLDWQKIRREEKDRREAAKAARRRFWKRR